MADVSHVLVLLNPAPDLRRKLEAIAPYAAYRYAGQAELTEEMVHRADVILGSAPARMAVGSPRLRWMQLTSAGSDAYQREGCFPKGALLTSASGSYGTAISEHMLAMLLTLMKNLHRYRDFQARRAWRPLGTASSVDGATALIIGMGDIGGAFARRVKALGGYAVGVRRNDLEKPSPADELHLAGAIDALLPRADIVALAVPGTEETRGILSRARIALMKPGAFILNVGRGSAIDTEALCDALTEGRIAGAGLDVTDPEPLPSGHRLWTMENAVITPHVSGGYRLRQTYDAFMDICLDNFRAYVEDRPLRNIVDFGRGY